MAKSIKVDVCQNCGTHLQGEFCHVCGQAAEEPRRAVVGLVQDVFVDTLAIDGKLARTFWLLLTRPGRLARRYLDGRRVHYSPPFRLYLFASVFFFFFAFWLSGADQWNGFDDADAPTAEEVQRGIDAALDEAEIDDEDRADIQRVIDGAIGESERSDVDGAPNERDELDAETGGSEESDEARSARIKFTDKVWADVEYDGPGWLEPHVKQAFEAAQRAVEDPRLFIAQTKENLPRALLLAPIFYAFLLLLFYIYRRRIYVYDHLVVSLYMHAALYAYLLTAIVINKIPVIGGLAFIPILWGLIQPYAVFRQAYGSNWFSVILKGFLSTTIYLAAIVLIISFGVSYSLYQS